MQDEKAVYTSIHPIIVNAKNERDTTFRSCPEHWRPQ
jgi:hypothetical protein